MVKAKRDSKGRFKAADTEAKSYGGFDGGNIWTPIGNSGGGFGSSDVYGGQPAPRPLDLIAAYEDVVYACVNLIANTVAGVDFKLCAVTRRGEAEPKCLTKSLDYSSRQHFDTAYRSFTRKALDVREVTDHPLLDLLDRPNPHQSFHKLLQLTQTYIELTGSAFWYLNRNSLGQVAELWLLPSQNVTVECDDNGQVTGYINANGEREEHLSPDDVLHIRFSNPLDPYAGFGWSPVRAVWQRVMLLRQEQSSWQAVLTNMALPSAMIYPPPGETFTDQQAERLARQVSQRFRMGEGGGTYVVTDAINYQPVSTPPKDLAALEMYDQIKSCVCNAYSVPRALLDLQDSTFAGADTAKRSFQEYCLLPRVKMILEALNHRLCPDRLFLAADNVVSEDRTYELQNRSSVVQEYTAGLRTLNEARQKIGLEPVTDGGRFVQQINPAPSYAPSAAAVQPVKSLALGGVRNKAYRPTAPDPRPMAQALSRVFTKMAGTVTLKSLGEARSKSFIPLQDWTDAMRGELTPVMRAYIQEGSAGIVAALGGDTAVPLLPVLELNRAVNAAVLALADSTLNTTTLDIERAVTATREAIRAGLDAGQADAELAATIKGIFTDLSDNRSLLIAQTESSRAKHTGELMEIQAAGVDCKKVWLPDNMACPICRDFASKGSIELDKSFGVNGEGAYAKIDHPPGHPGCRCTLQYTFPDLD